MQSKQSNVIRVRFAAAGKDCIIQVQYPSGTWMDTLKIENSKAARKAWKNTMRNSGFDVRVQEVA